MKKPLLYQPNPQCAFRTGALVYKPFTVKENGYNFFVLPSNTTMKYIFEMTVTQVFVNATDYKDPNYFTTRYSVSKNVTRMESLKHRFRMLLSAKPLKRTLKTTFSLSVHALGSFIRTTTSSGWDYWLYLHLCFWQ